MKQLYIPTQLTIRENQQKIVEVVEDGVYGHGTDRPGMPYSRMVGAFPTIEHAKRVFPFAHVTESLADSFRTALADHTSSAAERIANSITPSDMDTEVIPDPVYDAAIEVIYDEQGVPY